MSASPRQAVLRRSRDASAARGVFMPQLSTWVRQSVAGILALGLVLTLNVWLGELEPGNSWSLWYGGVAVFLLLAALALAGRRRAQATATRLRLGSARAWLDLHLAGGVVFLVLVLMHGGFRWPTGALGRLLLVLSIWTVASGLLGLLAQRILPRILASSLSVEVLYQRADELVDELRQRARRVASEAGPPISSFYESSLERRFARLQPRWSYLLDVSGGRQQWRRGFDHLAERVDDSAGRALSELERMLQTKIEIDASYSVQRALRWWLWLHVPTSILLVFAVALHVGANLYY
ncbi:MAG: hypothetical protein DWQ36_20850 [Acidobacteria bacterium]|nr:MAG: hypothetical protein DWQ30_21280 [Acidobacteriota bacterium]REK03314.1 MAG: hypothetical protein DWQ36_20850 [Acidobacteriota bacterium]